MPKYSYETINAYVRKRGGRLLSKSVGRARDKVNVSCLKCGSEWSPQIYSLMKLKTWCPTCAIRKNSGPRLSFDKIQKTVSKRKGKILVSKDKYLGLNYKYEFECKDSHRWTALASSIYNQGTWCPKCVGKNKSIDDVRALIANRNGILLTKKIPKTGLVRVQCTAGHKWKTLVSSIVQGRWCPKCAGKNKDISIFKTEAKKRGGKCLSERYLRYNTKYKFECINKHFFKIAGNQFLSGAWCPECSQNYGENITRIYLERIFRLKFKKSRPVWLRSRKGTQLELDGFNEKRKIAFEHHGQQHYVSGAFRFNNRDLEDRKDLDNEKIQLCKKNGVKLIVIPDVIHILGLENLPNLISKECKRLKIQAPNLLPIDDVNLDSGYRISHRELMQEYSEIAKSKNLKLLDKTYFGVAHKYRFQCLVNKKHQFKRNLYNLKVRSNCPYCRGMYQTVADMQTLAAKIGGRFISTEFNGTTVKHQWQCAEGHIWEAVPDSIKSGHWCPTCNRGLKRTFSDLNKLAEQKEGLCLSTTWHGPRAKYSFSCKNGHKWENTAYKVFYGQWCRACADVEKGKKRRDSTLSRIRIFAEKRGGQCISDDYNGPKSVLKFRCKNGHLFQLFGWEIYRNNWCKKCLK